MDRASSSAAAIRSDVDSAGVAAASTPADRPAGRRLWPRPARNRSRSRSARRRSPSGASSDSPLRHVKTDRARVLMRAETAAPPPVMPGIEYWQHTLWNFSADARSRLPRLLGRAPRWLLPCAGAAAEITVAQANPLCSREPVWGLTRDPERPFVERPGVSSHLKFPTSSPSLWISARLNTARPHQC